MACVITSVRIFDLDHVGTNIGKQRRSKRPRQHSGEIENANSR